MAAFLLILLFGIGLIAGPIVASTLGSGLGAVTSVIMTVSGIVLTLMSGILFIVTKLYVKTKASEAFVRTGMGGIKMIKDGGALVVPVIHQIIRVSLQTMRLEVSREGLEALLTLDKLRADVRGEFFVKVQADDDAIQAAARSFGEKMMDADAVKALVEDKLVSALRTVAATKTLEELNSERDKFMEQVTEIIAPDLSHNGLTLETATISKLDQTNPENLNPNNVFDAQGLKTIAEITQAQLTQQNLLEREGEQARKAQDVATRKRVLELEQQRAEAEAAQVAEIAKFQAERTRESREAEIESSREVEVAERAKQQAVEVAEQEKQQGIEVAEQEKQRVVKLAEQAVEVAERAKQQAVAQAEQERAAAEADLAKAEATREMEQQRILTVKVTEEAERGKKQSVISAEAKAETAYVTEQRKADAEAYTVQKEAEAKKLAADAEAEAITKEANANRDAKIAEAAGSKAVALVPVEVKRQEVEVDRDRVETVIKPELEAREQHGKVAQDFELAKLEIEKRAEVQIAAAGATATLVGKVNAQVYGTPEDVTRMAQSLARGIGAATTVNGFVEGADDKTQALFAGVLQQLQDIASSFTKKSDTALPEPEVADADDDAEVAGSSGSSR